MGAHPVAVALTLRPKPRSLVMADQRMAWEAWGGSRWADRSFPSALAGPGTMGRPGEAVVLEAWAPRGFASEQTALPPPRESEPAGSEPWADAMARPPSSRTRLGSPPAAVRPIGARTPQFRSVGKHSRPRSACICQESARKLRESRRQRSSLPRASCSASCLPGARPRPPFWCTWRQQP